MSLLDSSRHVGDVVGGWYVSRKIAAVRAMLLNGLVLSIVDGEEGNSKDVVVGLERSGAGGRSRRYLTLRTPAQQCFEKATRSTGSTNSIPKHVRTYENSVTSLSTSHMLLLHASRKLELGSRLESAGAFSKPNERTRLASTDTGNGHFIIVRKVDALLATSKLDLLLTVSIHL